VYPEVLLGSCISTFVVPHTTPDKRYNVVLQ